jgi:hypothetical protein
VFVPETPITTAPQQFETASINKQRQQEIKRSLFDNVFKGQRQDGEGSGSASRYRSAKPLKVRPYWNVLELLVINAEAVGHGMIISANLPVCRFQRPYNNAKHKQQSTAGDLDLQKWRCTKLRTGVLDYRCSLD